MAKQTPGSLNKILSSRSGFVQSAIWASVALGLGFFLTPLILGFREQRKLLRRPEGRVVKAPFAIDVDQKHAYDS